ncbi:YgjV family protein [Photobacterium sp. ZSDE20]|uniref:YgjV family protein n=1 Tax=Photobacterium pectinilyticum TaxID=2906793 RepID=A0ABT1N8F3_9GAMM|nr:YgjV family protein [Photobacterium sp. ZSDE20]MCQ1061011.1 YgjV family protein [Photobacterium sp. ZSDE20]MDD1829014.1 YgjV family protein [Photobacterium sp. ZSDE20]
MLSEFSLAQAFGFVSFALGITAFYQKDDKKLKVLMVIFNINHMIHFFLLGAVIASFSALISAFRTALSVKYQSKLLAYFFIVCNLVVGFYLSERWLDLLPIAGACIGTYALFCLEGIKMRLAFFVGALCWLSNNIVVGSIGGTLLEATLLSVNVATIIRLRRQQRAMPKLTCCSKSEMPSLEQLANQP